MMRIINTAEIERNEIVGKEGKKKKEKEKNLQCMID